MECRPRWTAAARRRSLRRNTSCPEAVDYNCYEDDNDDSDSANNNNLSVGVYTAGTSNMNDTTVLVDELEQLRTDNFQLRLRVYNAERRVDRLSAAAVAPQSRDRSSSSSSGSDDSDSEDDARAAAASAKATAEAAVRTIHDLLTVNRRLLALLAAAVSAKAVAVTGRDKRRWQKLRNRLRDCDGVGAPIEEDEEPEKSDDGSDATSSVDSETRATAARKRPDDARATEATTTTRKTPPRTPEDADQAAVAGDEELVRLRARCRRLERSLQQLVNTELWARNRQIGKLEQQRYATQADRSRPAADPAPAAGGKPVNKSSPPPDVLPAKNAITTPPPVLPDYSEVNFFYSCDEDDDDEEDDDEDNRENGSETNAAGLSSTEEETASGDDEKEPVKLRTETTAAVGRVCAPLAASSPRIVHSQKPKRRRLHRQKRDDAFPSSTESVQSVAAACDPNGDDGRVTTSTSPTQSRRRHRVANRRRRRGPARRCSACGGVADRGASGGSVDAQVQCSDAELVPADSRDDGDDSQAGLLRRELEARRRENRRLYDMLLRLQRGRSETVSPVRLPGDDPDDEDGDSPEPYRRAARAVRGRIADLLPPLLSTARPDGSAAPTPLQQQQQHRQNADNNERTLLRQQQQQLLLLARLRERIVAYERQELLGGGPDLQENAATADPQQNAVERMDRAALVNVALPRAVDRLRRALVPLLQHKQQQQQRNASPRQMETAAAERE